MFHSQGEKKEETAGDNPLLCVLCSFGKILRDEFSSSLNEFRVEIIKSLVRQIDKIGHLGCSGELMSMPVDKYPISKSSNIAQRHLQHLLSFGMKHSTHCHLQYGRMPSFPAHYSTAIIKVNPIHTERLQNFAPSKHPILFFRFPL